MTHPPSHREVDELLPAAALEILEREELQLVLAHVEECAECARTLQSYRDVVAGLASTLPCHPFPAARSGRVRARLLTRARHTPPPTGSETAARTPNRRRVASWADRWSGWVVAAGLAGLLLIHHSVHRPLAYGWLVAGVLTLALLVLALYLRRQRSRLRQLEDRLAALDQENAGRGGPPRP